MLFSKMGLQDTSLPQQLQKLKIDKAFLLPPEHRPQHAYNSYLFTNDHIPLIDLFPLHSFPRNEAKHTLLIQQIGRACEEWGFFQVFNHGLPLNLLEKVKQEARAFFALPLEEKRRVQRTFEDPLGYYDTELTKNVRDWKEVFDFAADGEFELPVDSEGGRKEIGKYRNQWPSNPHGLREACEEYAAAAKKLAFSLLELISQSLGLPPDFFHCHFNSSTSFLRLNHYPVCPSPELALGVSRHKDVGALTVLAQDDVGGLEVRRKDGKWIGVNPDASAFVINVGDLIQVWSNDKYHSVEHRVVVNENKDRYSIPLFFNPAHSTVIGPIARLLDENNPPRYQPFNWGKYIKKRTDSNFKNLGVENLQIADYTIAHKNLL